MGDSLRWYDGVALIADWVGSGRKIRYTAHGESMAINLISGEHSPAPGPRINGGDSGTQTSRESTGTSIAETPQPVREPAAVIADSLRRVGHRDQNSIASPMQSHQPVPVADIPAPPGPEKPFVLAADAAAMITSDAELAVLAQAHQLPSPVMPISVDT